MRKGPHTPTRCFEPGCCGPSVERETSGSSISENAARPEIALNRAFSELTGFEPVTPSLRKMWSDRSDQGIWRARAALWGGGGTSDLRHRESW